MHRVLPFYLQLILIKYMKKKKIKIHLATNVLQTVLYDYYILIDVLLYRLAFLLKYKY